MKRGAPSWAPGTSKSQDVSILLLRCSVGRAVNPAPSDLCKPFGQSLWHQALGLEWLWGRPQEDLQVLFIGARHAEQREDGDAGAAGAELGEDPGSLRPQGLHSGRTESVHPAQSRMPPTAKGRKTLLFVNRTNGGYNPPILLKWPANYMMKLSRKQP